MDSIKSYNFKLHFYLADNQDKKKERYDIINEFMMNNITKTQYNC